MQNIRLAPPFDITHTLIYPNIDNLMALKIKGAKQFPDKKTLLDLAMQSPAPVRDAKHIIDRYASLILDGLNAIHTHEHFNGLKQSITTAVDHVMRTNVSVKAYRHDRKLKHPK